MIQSESLKRVPRKRSEVFAGEGGVRTCQTTKGLDLLEFSFQASVDTMGSIANHENIVFLMNLTSCSLRRKREETPRKLIGDMGLICSD